MSLLCPCGSTLRYADCCQPFHLATQFPMTAEQLMRSRYTAFVLQLTDYIVNTTVPFEQALLDQQAISEWSTQTQWDGLEVINHVANTGKRHAQVAFKAYFIHEGQRLAHHELSTFVKITAKADGNTRWYFLDPTIPLSISQKQPCPCGSGEKYKRCCGQFLA